MVPCTGHLIIVVTFLEQVHKRIQKTYNDTDAKRMKTPDDMGFCLYPVLESGHGGSGLNFSALVTNTRDDELQRPQKNSTGCYAFKPLEALQGAIKIKVNFQRGVDPKVQSWCIWISSLILVVARRTVLTVTGGQPTEIGSAGFLSAYAVRITSRRHW